MTAPALTIKKAERTAVKLKVFIAGPSGGGKTRGALHLARNIFGPSAKICVIDTERESASYYADEIAFDTISLDAPFTTERYLEALRLVCRSGYDVGILDSITHQWSGVGGLLERKDAYDSNGQQRGNKFNSWQVFTPEHEQFRNALLAAPIHLIACARAKQEYVVEEGDRGRKTVQKVGLKPDQREGLEYEFGLAWMLQMDNRADVMKDRTRLFTGKRTNLLDPEVGRAIRGWLDAGAPDRDAKQNGTPTPPKGTPVQQPAAAAKPTTPAPSTQEATDADRARLYSLKLAGKTDSWALDGKAWGQQPIGEVPDKVLKQAKHFFADKLKSGDGKPWMEDQLEAIALVMADREAAAGQGTLDFPTQVAPDPAAEPAVPVAAGDGPNDSKDDLPF